jgi:ATP-dependent RNA circularization protein (DNA/RNA ligase family)
MLYNIRVEFMDGTVTEFPRKSNIKPINSVKLNDKIAKQIFPAQWKEITSTPVY